MVMRYADVCAGFPAMLVGVGLGRVVVDWLVTRVSSSLAAHLLALVAVMFVFLGIQVAVYRAIAVARRWTGWFDRELTEG